LGAFYVQVRSRTRARRKACGFLPAGRRVAYEHRERVTPSPPDAIFRGKPSA